MVGIIPWVVWQAGKALVAYNSGNKTLFLACHLLMLVYLLSQPNPPDTFVRVVVVVQINVYGSQALRNRSSAP